MNSALIRSSLKAAGLRSDHDEEEEYGRLGRFNSRPCHDVPDLIVFDKVPPRFFTKLQSVRVAPLR